MSTIMILAREILLFLHFLRSNTKEDISNPLVNKDNRIQRKDLNHHLVFIPQSKLLLKLFNRKWKEWKKWVGLCKIL